MKDNEALVGVVNEIIFMNKENGYTVFEIEAEGEYTVCVGTTPEVIIGEEVSLSGRWTNHQTYGRQFNFDTCEKNIPTTIEGIEKYLSSGLIKGVGAKTAKKIVERFGESSFYVIEEKPDRLVEIKGINLEKAMRISEAFREQYSSRRIMIFLGTYNLPQSMAYKIYKKYGSRVYEVIKSNPYKLIDDIYGIGFKKADEIAKDSGVLLDSYYRVRAGIIYILNEGASQGHTFLPFEQVILEAVSLLGITEEAVRNSLREVQLERIIRVEKIRDIRGIYLSKYFFAETGVSKRLIELSNLAEDIDELEISSIIKKSQKKNGIDLGEDQRRAVEKVFNTGVIVITGGPGTGKTTIINSIIDGFSYLDKKVVLAAPTGRAAKRMAETCGIGASTIHRLLGITHTDEGLSIGMLDYSNDEPIDADVVIIDEVSMIDIMLMFSLLKAIQNGTRVVLVGDSSQLPSVGCGNVLKDIIASEKIEVVKLTKIFRQSKESAIILNAHRINNGEEPLFGGEIKDFFIMKRNTSEGIKNTVIDLVKERLPRYTGCDPFLDIQVLTPMRKGIAGISSLNSELQSALNPITDKKKEKTLLNRTFREGDKVMQIKNNYNRGWKIITTSGKLIEEGIGVYNGDQGVITKIDTKNDKLIVLMDDNKTVDYDFTNLDELELSYAITIHKSQGSEYHVVVLSLPTAPPMLMTRNLLYTAVTRARNLVVIVGSVQVIREMIENNREENRYTGLKERLINVYSFMYGDLEN